MALADRCHPASAPRGLGARVGAAVIGADRVVLLDWGRPVDGWVLLVVALVLPIAASSLWGKQFGAGLVAAIAALWILPAAAFGALGYVVYKLLEFLAAKSGLE